jgi:hypothetical protein
MNESPTPTPRTEHKRFNRDNDNAWPCTRWVVCEDFARTLERELNEALALIKELNATKFQHGRQYRSRCGQFLTKNHIKNNLINQAIDEASF